MSLRYFWKVIDGNREVNNCPGESCARHYKIVFFMTSAKIGKRVKHCFHTLVRLMRKKKKTAETATMMDRY